MVSGAAVADPPFNLDAVCRVMSRKQIRSIMECNARINLWSGAVSSGKTIASLMAFLFAVARAPENGLVFIVGRTLDTVGRNIMEPLTQPFGPFGPVSRFITYTQGANRAKVFGRTVYLVGANDVLAEGRIRGATAALIYIDEATLIPESFFTMCLSRLRVPGAKLLATTNPDGPMHWLRRRFMLNRQLNMRQWHFTLDDNPSLTPSYVQSLKAEYTGLFYDRFILGRWCLAEGAVYSAWNPDRHVVDELPPISDWIGVGIDYGTVNPFAAELLALGGDGRLYLAGEWYYDSKVKRRELSDAEYAEQVKRWLLSIPLPGGQRGVEPGWVVMDPSAASMRTALLGYGIQSVLADNAVMPGIRQLGSLIATDRFRVHKSCQGFIDEIPGYSWDADKAEKGEDAPLPVNDHALDAVRYVARTTAAVWSGRLREPLFDLAA